MDFMDQMDWMDRMNRHHPVPKPSLFPGGVHFVHFVHYLRSSSIQSIPQPVFISKIKRAEDGLPRFARNDGFSSASLREARLCVGVFDVAIHAFLAFYSKN